MVAVTRLVTFVDVGEQALDTVCVSVLQEAELADGSRVVLLDDRGWTSSGGWARTSAEDIRATARVVVGPDEPFGGRSQANMEADHWVSLQLVAERRGFLVDAAELRQAPHDVELGPRVLARLGDAPDSGAGD
ncbi:hypothetical protein LP52_05665 [Streptomonospora alba]|uniref:Uncharacterized protein n=1 Tax=Streptomonospora alba TaxID=183763 RepID=A0A0C2FK32_9ACTN|nr:hypothetical protein [Streptomonospora alba]KIH99714.1 hypothetical protein LP52_05665 [Streptomonospora alba]